MESKVIVFAENSIHSDFVFVRYYEDGFMEISTSMVRACIFSEENAIQVAQAFRKCPRIDVNTITIRTINREPANSIDKNKYDEIGIQPISLNIPRIRHIWTHRHDGRSSYYTCPKCSCIKKSAPNGFIYCRDGKEYLKAPECLY
jgi:uncharacterized C2H2 Zn-finger protein